MPVIYNILYDKDEENPWEPLYWWLIVQGYLHDQCNSYPLPYSAKRKERSECQQLVPFDSVYCLC